MKGRKFAEASNTCSACELDVVGAGGYCGWGAERKDRVARQLARPRVSLKTSRRLRDAGAASCPCHTVRSLCNALAGKLPVPPGSCTVNYRRAEAVRSGRRDASSRSTTPGASPTAPPNGAPGRNLSRLRFRFSATRTVCTSGHLTLNRRRRGHRPTSFTRLCRFSLLTPSAREALIVSSDRRRWRQ